MDKFIKKYLSGPNEEGKYNIFYYIPMEALCVNPFDKTGYCLFIDVNNNESIKRCDCVCHKKMCFHVSPCCATPDKLGLISFEPQMKRYA